MKVKVSYTTNIEEVPYECWRLLDYKIHNGVSFTENLKNLYQSLDDTNTDPAKILKDIHQIRLVLSDYDQCLSDIDAILTGLVNIRLQPDNKHDIVDKQAKDE